ncbi:IS5 family transposase [Kitasatospora sp. NPDC127111]|uniref:IS5 family transposase n=1 Tax=Kitasatospora sp. NPDC127111 TaxID=3345363 RepID=UPI0036260AA5
MSGSGGGYPSDLTDEQWALVEPLLPPARVGPKGGRREKYPRRRIVDASFYVVRTGCAWRQLPKDFAPWPTVYWYLTWWHDDGTVERIHDALRGKVREADGRDAEPSAGLIDLAVRPHCRHRRRGHQGLRCGQEGQGPKAVHRHRHPWPAAGRPRRRGEHSGPRRREAALAVDQARPPGVRKVWVDQGFAGRLVEWTAQILGRDLEIVRKEPNQRGFQVQPKRWAVERTFSWLTAHRRLARDYETSPARSETMIRWAMIGIMVRRLTRGRPAARPGPRRLLLIDP